MECRRSNRGCMQGKWPSPCIFAPVHYSFIFRIIILYLTLLSHTAKFIFGLALGFTSKDINLEDSARRKDGKRKNKRITCSRENAGPFKGRERPTVLYFYFQATLNNAEANFWLLRSHSGQCLGDCMWCWELNQGGLICKAPHLNPYTTYLSGLIFFFSQKGGGVGTEGRRGDLIQFLALSGIILGRPWETIMNTGFETISSDAQITLLCS